MIPGFFAAGAGGGAPPIPVQVPFYSSDLITSTGWEVAGYPGAFYDHVEGRTYVAWQFVGGLAKGVHVAAYDHATQSWGEVCRAGNFILPNDDHGYAMLVKDAEGYIHCLFGSHANTQKWSVTNAPNDISAWRQMGDISGSLTYPKPALVGSTIYLLLRNDSPLSHRRLVLTSLTPSGGTGSWAIGFNIIDFGTDSRVYATEVHVRGTDLHFCCTRANASDSVRKHVYYFIYDTVTGSVYNYDKTAAVSSLPVTLAQADADYRIVESVGTDGSDLPSLQFDTANNAHVLYVDGAASPVPIKHMMLSGGGWSAPVVVADIVDKYPSLGYTDSYHLAPGVAGTMQAWYNKGGDKIRRIRSAAGTWGAEETIAVHGEREFVQGTPVLNPHSSLRVLFSEHSGSAADSSALALPMYAYGDGGFIGEIDQTPIDPFWQQTTLLLGCRDGAGSHSVVDESLSCRGAALNGGAAMSPDGPFSGVNSIRMAGTSDFAQLQSSSVYGPSGAFTAECVFKLDEVGRLQFLVTNRGSNTPGFALMVLATNEVYFNVYQTNGTTVAFSIGGGAVIAGVWYHLAGVVDGAVGRVFLNGALVASGAVSGTIGTVGDWPRLGRDPNNSGRWLNGRISQVRITQAARYSSAFTPPSGPFPRR